MKYLYKFNEGFKKLKHSSSKEKSTEDILKEVLSHDGWVKLEPERSFWEYQLEYKLNKDYKITLLLLKDNKDFSYYLEDNRNFNFVSNYKNNHTLLFSEDSIIHKDLSDYERMMKICNYLSPFLTKRPDYDLIDDLRHCFIEIEDELEVEPEIEWGYKDDKGEWGYFPAFRFSDKLGLFLMYNVHQVGDIITGCDFDKIKLIFDEIKNKVKYYDIHTSNVNLVDDNWRVIIEIIF